MNSHGSQRGEPVKFDATKWAGQIQLTGQVNAISRLLDHVSVFVEKKFCSSRLTE